MAFQMHRACALVDSKELSKQFACPIFHWSLYETITSSLHPRHVCCLRPKPDGTLDAVRRAAESFVGCSRWSKCGQKPCRHWAAGSKLWVRQRADRAQRIWDGWLCQCRIQI